MDVGAIAGHLDESTAVHGRLKEIARDIGRAADLCVDSLTGGGKIIFLGNGGSAADAQHLACEMVVKYRFERPAIPAIALTANTSVLTASANDRGFETIFARQIEALARAGDVVVAISTSGASANVLAAARVARDTGCRVVALTGSRGTALADAADVAIVVPHDRADRVQEAHITIGHVICECVEDALHGRTSEA